jgi:hypothetical protein
MTDHSDLKRGNIDGEMAPRIVAIDGLPYGSPEQIAADYFKAVAPLASQYPMGSDGRQIIINASLAFAVVSLRRLGIGLTDIQRNVRALFEADAPGGLIL